MNAPLPKDLIPTNIAAMDTELDIVALARSGGMALAAMVSHAEHRLTHRSANSRQETPFNRPPHKSPI